MHRLAPGLALVLALACGEPARGASGAEYQALRSSIEATRTQLARDYDAARHGRDRRAVLGRARGALVRAVVGQLAPTWLGTPWAFSGTTEVPGEGAIACGQFVATLAAHAGLRVDRLSLGRQASENIIKSLTTAPYIRRFSDVSIRAFVDAVETMGDGLFLVGLDTHAGLLVVEAGKARFLHSVNLGCWCVQEEDARTSPILIASRYRVVGKISDDDALVERWLRGTRIETVGPH